MASSSSPLVNIESSLSLNRKRVRDELSRGREMAGRLRVNLSEAGDGGDGGAQLSPLSAQSLVAEIIETFTRSLLMLNGGGGNNNVGYDGVVPDPARGAEYSGDGDKKPANKDRRGSYKRRRTSEETYTKETTGSFEDGYAWRKYGQKKILDTKYPRHYYRCTHKYDQGCQAKKQVQQLQDNPSIIYRTTYESQHTCKNNLTQNTLLPHNHQQFTTDIVTGEDDSPSSLVWNFQQAADTVKTPPPTPPFDYYFMPINREDHHRLHDLGGDMISNSENSCTASTHSISSSADVQGYNLDSCEFDDFLMDEMSC